jgi:hypothetical protein
MAGVSRNTNAMAALIHQQLELDPAVNTPNGIIRQAKLRESNAARIGKLERNYREYTAELRRRYSLEWSAAYLCLSAAKRMRPAGIETATFADPTREPGRH